MIIDLAVLNAGNLTASVVAGLLAGLYTHWVFGARIEATPRRRALLIGWYWGFLASILYVARIVFSLYREAVDPGFTSDLPRVTAGWALFLLFAVFVGLGELLASRWAIERQKAAIRRER